MDVRGQWKQPKPDEDFPAKDIETIQNHLTHLNVGHTTVMKDVKKNYDSNVDYILLWCNSSRYEYSGPKL